jgi:dTDP-4-dehydrorhamnose reductase
MKIIILGSNGMLGQMTSKYFSDKNFEVINHNEYFTQKNYNTYFDDINKLDSSVVINCIGKIKQKSSDPNELLWSNSIFPLTLSSKLDDKHLLIHPSTDCVFNELKNDFYSLRDNHDALDIYGFSKSIAENAISSHGNYIIVRVSIIGPDFNSKSGLLSWFLNLESGSEVNGYSNHFWNGITTLEWCKQVENLISKSGNIKYNKVIQLGTKNMLSKHEILKLFNEIFKKNILITPFETPDQISRCLVPEIISVNLEQQLNELKDYLGQ